MTNSQALIALAVTAILTLCVAILGWIAYKKRKKSEWNRREL